MNKKQKTIYCRISRTMVHLVSRLFALSNLFQVFSHNGANLIKSSISRAISVRQLTREQRIYSIWCLFRKTKTFTPNEYFAQRKSNATPFKQFEQFSTVCTKTALLCGCVSVSAVHWTQNTNWFRTATVHRSSSYLSTAAPPSTIVRWRSFERTAKMRSLTRSKRNSTRRKGILISK